MPSVLAQLIQYVKALDLPETAGLPSNGYFIYSHNNELRRVQVNEIVSRIIQATFEVIDGQTVIPMTGYRRYRVLTPDTYQMNDQDITVTQDEIDNNWVFIVTDDGVSHKELEPKPDTGSTIKDWSSSETELEYPSVRKFSGRIYRVKQGETSGSDEPDDSNNWELLIVNTINLEQVVNTVRLNVGDTGELETDNTESLVDAINEIYGATIGVMYLELLQDVDLEDPQEGDALVFVDGFWVNKPISADLPDPPTQPEINDLEPEHEETVFSWNWKSLRAVLKKWFKLDDLANADTSGKNDGDVLYWNNAGNKWRAKNLGSEFVKIEMESSGSIFRTYKRRFPNILSYGSGASSSISNGIKIKIPSKESYFVMKLYARETTSSGAMVNNPIEITINSQILSSVNWSEPKIMVLSSYYNSLRFIFSKEEGELYIYITNNSSDGNIFRGFEFYDDITFVLVRPAGLNEWKSNLSIESQRLLPDPSDIQYDLSGDAILPIAKTQESGSTNTATAPIIIVNDDIQLQYDENDFEVVDDKLTLKESDCTEKVWSESSQEADEICCELEKVVRDQISGNYTIDIDANGALFSLELTGPTTFKFDNLQEAESKVFKMLLTGEESFDFDVDNLYSDTLDNYSGNDILTCHVWKSGGITNLEVDVRPLPDSTQPIAITGTNFEIDVKKNFGVYEIDMQTDHNFQFANLENNETKAFQMILSGEQAFSFDVDNIYSDTLDDYDGTGLNRLTVNVWKDDDGTTNAEIVLVNLNQPITLFEEP